jgi:S-adenosylmethionine hydrolase
MPDPIITLTTDFGEDSPYVAAMKGVILGLNPDARIVDLSHLIPAQDVVHAAFFLAEAIPYFPTGPIHVVVVDPGVGTPRHLLYGEIDGHRLAVPDNGVWTLLARGRSLNRVHQLTETRWWRKPVSATFHGRDILAPAAAQLSLGLDPEALGPKIDDWIKLPLALPAEHAEAVQGEVLFIDHFGNLITNIPGAALPPDGPRGVSVGGIRIQEWVRTYGDAPPGTLVALLSSSGLLEIAIVQGNAAQRFGLQRGAAVQVY